MIDYKIIKNTDYQELQNELTRNKLVETSLRAEIARLKRDKEQLEIIRNNQYLKIDELNRDIEGYKEYLVPIDQMPLITGDYNPKGFSTDVVNYIASAKNSVEIISYLEKETNKC
ncbi:hypothetical protein RR45_GL000161 [Lactococcus chungangensis CAU 28 = DSM 22330]|uniref:Uncharacterized protein n=1 Tax=Pseudolactococcus chungangensis CAU 28 = DSM 22330 TaxID=1122154 RepID=A0A1K2HAX6_9LACT|nr:hypothetical protein [Lactococcus chungangensis]PCS04842.1 hypothetical protein RR45_GL000161 [Lactococcus chungangensis CAU 28 = DSM 22330]SFZ73964.1 hypothetical protein SAMN02746068_01020 [Lactococcus chungangensis CAU 28 = DSM 22330]